MMPFSYLLPALAAVLGLGNVNAQAQARRHYVDPPPEIYSNPVAAMPDAEVTSSVREASPSIVIPWFATQPPRDSRRGGCSTTTYVTGELLDQEVRVHRS